MKKNYVRNGRKRKITTLFQKNQYNPQQIAQQNLFQISDQYQIMNQQKIQSNSYNYFKTQQRQSKQQKVNHQLHSFKNKSIKTNSIDFKQIPKSSLFLKIFNQSSKMINLLQSKSVFVGKKSPINATSYAVINNKNSQKFISVSNLSNKSLTVENNKIATNFRKIFRKKSNSSSKSTANRFFYVSPNNKNTFASKKIDKDLITNKVVFKKPYSLLNQKL